MFAPMRSHCSRGLSDDHTFLLTAAMSAYGRLANISEYVFKGTAQTASRAQGWPLVSCQIARRLRPRVMEWNVRSPSGEGTPVSSNSPDNRWTSIGRGPDSNSFPRAR